MVPLLSLWHASNGTRCHPVCDLPGRGGHDRQGEDLNVILTCHIDATHFALHKRRGAGFTGL